MLLSGKQEIICGYNLNCRHPVVRQRHSFTLRSCWNNAKWDV